MTIIGNPPILSLGDKKMNVLNALEQGWTGMGDLVKMTGEEAPSLRDQLKSLMAEGKVQKTGNKRGTKYALPGADAPLTQSGDDFKAKIREFMNAQQKQVSRKEIAEFVGTYDAKIRPPLLEMVESGEVCHNQKKKGQLFWLLSHEDKGIIVPEKAKEEKVEVEKAPSKEEMPVVTDIQELVKKGVNDMIDHSSLSISEVKSKISKCARNSFSLAEIFSAFKNMLVGGLLPSVKYETRKEDGMIYYWTE